MQAASAEVVIIGGGPIGLTAAVALAGAGIDTALVATPPPQDNRTTALLAGSVTALDTLGVWQHCRDQAAPLRVMRLVDDTARLLRAPETVFDAAEIGLDAFGHNIENRHLLAALDAHAAGLGELLRLADAAQTVEAGPDGVAVGLASGGMVRAKLAIGADGRRSLCRAAAGIRSETRSYPQSALTCNLAHARPHADTSTELHTESGPFTLVPLPGRRSSLVCVVDPATAERLRHLDDTALSLELERRAHSILGKFQVEPGRGLFPLVSETAQRLAGERIALIGEAGHVFPPIGAQGLNLGLRDAATIAELVAAAHRRGEDVGGAEVTRRYDEIRRADVAGRSVAVDLLNRSLLADFLPVQGARGLGLYLLDRIGPLRRAVMREGVAPAAQPRLMHGEAL